MTQTGNQGPSAARAETSGLQAAPAESLGVSVIVPTYREVENIPKLVDSLRAVRDRHGLKLELLLMDDDSKDGSEELVASINEPWVRIIVRKKDRGLSQAVMDGLRAASYDYLVCMDADLSHPPEKVPELVNCLRQGYEFAVGSRFVEGGSTDDDWGLFRWANSRVATLLALPLTSIKDPMSGFFALEKSTFLRGLGSYNPIGYKIGLEILVKCNCKRVAEVPIHFQDRQLGKSKLTFKEQMRYLQHVRRLYIHRYGTWSHLAQFAVVGLSGAVLNLLLLTALLVLGLSREPAVAVAIAVSMIWNFVLNRRFSFSYARKGSIVRQFLGFVGACSIGAVINYFATLGVWHYVPNAQVAALIGILAGMCFNFLMNRFLVFKARHVRV